MDWVIFGCCNSTGWGWQQQSQGHGFDFQGIHKLIKYLPWMLCKSLWEKVFVKWMNVNLWGTQSWHEKRSSLKRWKPLILRKLWHSHRHIPNISEWNILIDLTERGESHHEPISPLYCHVFQSETEYLVRQKNWFLCIDNWLHHKKLMLHTRSDCKSAVDCGGMLFWKCTHPHAVPVWFSYFCGTQKMMF